MTEDQEERLVSAWEGIAKGLGDLHEIAKTAIAKQWPEARQPREANITRIPSAEDKIKAQTGNTDGPIDEWLSEFDPEEEIGPREREFLAKQAARAKASSKAKGSRKGSVSSPRS
jgi:hypothetical protein